MRRWCGTLLLALAAGCLGLGDRVVSVSDTDGSSDHRIFRIGAVTKLMMEPVLWKLEDLKLIDFDRPVTEFFNGFLPPEYESVTLRDLHDGRSGLPLTLIDPYCLGDLGDLCAAAAFGFPLCGGFDSRDAFVARLWTRHYRKDVERREPRRSDAAYALLMMAVCDRLGLRLDELCERYLVEPYGLKDTSFVPYQGMRNRLTRPCAGLVPLALPRGCEVSDYRGSGEVTLFSGGMLSSAYDILRVAYVIRPLLDRAKPILESARLPCGRDVWYLTGTTPGGHAFVGFDPEGGHAVAVLENATGIGSGDGLELLENLANPPKEEKK